MNATTAKTTAARPVRPHRSYVVADTLDELSGPAAGEVKLPNRLDWGPPRTYVLHRDADARLFYERVLREAASPADLKLLNAAVLRRLWRSLVLPQPLRRTWESRFGSLGR